MGRPRGPDLSKRPAPPPRPKVHSSARKLLTEHTELLDYLGGRQDPNVASPRQGCNTCQMPRVEEAISLYLASVRRDRAHGRLPKRIEGFHRLLVKHYEYPLQRDALVNHIRRCRGESF